MGYPDHAAHRAGDDSRPTAEPAPDHHRTEQLALGDKPYAVDCAPINPSKYARFAAFLAAAVARYSQPPYHAVYWQIGNEPDANIFPNDSGFGCWGVKTDPYYGGRAYGEMLSARGEFQPAWKFMVHLRQR